MAPLLNQPVLVNSTTIMLSWEELNCSDWNGVIIGYNIQYNNTNEGVQSSVNNSGATSIIITGLTEFRLYNISIAAINDNGVGPYTQAYTIYTG